MNKNIENTMTFSVYGIKIKHPNNWDIFINNQMPFKFDNGFVKIDSSAIKKNDSSMVLRWIKSCKINSIDDYITEYKRQFNVKNKKYKNDLYQLLELEKINDNIYFSWSRITANHSIFRILKNNETFDSLQLSFFDSNTNRLVIQTITTDTNNIDTKFEYYKDMLLQLQCE